ncbi:hypothetical protein SKAU_G00388490 [Synaphobranchus kaupii]|uniref:Uncharacterized protein n=1 Tax=Synaphobranchus kaupii TaxID=118154 RepID=A0A9Q1IDD6_SYNKA|nr:hypothetical protein SKAU_G00388490 [Synaphobranchus kaupii]
MAKLQLKLAMLRPQCAACASTSAFSDGENRELQRSLTFIEKSEAGKGGGLTSSPAGRQAYACLSTASAWKGEHLSLSAIPRAFRLVPSTAFAISPLALPHPRSTAAHLEFLFLRCASLGVSMATSP